MSVWEFRKMVESEIPIWLVFSISMIIIGLLLMFWRIDKGE